MNIIYLGLGVLFVIVLLVIIVRALRPRSDYEHLDVDHCGSVCPNMGACDDCDIGFP